MGSPLDQDGSDREQAVAAREAAVAERERQLWADQARQNAEHDVWLSECIRLRDELLRARQDVEQTRAEREHLLMQMREANEKLIMASLHAEELAERADAGRRRAEHLAAQLATSQAAMRDSEDQFRTIANALPMLAWYANPDGDIAWLNERWYAYTGTRVQDQVGCRWESVHDPSDLPRVLAKWRAAIDTGEPWEDTFRLRRHDGELRWFLARALPLKDAAGNTVRWFGTGVDIDAEKRAESEVGVASRVEESSSPSWGTSSKIPSPRS